ncbi:MAG: hypothetical protein V1722_02590 [Candidatus Micrarchaeota archaeon]
MELVILTNNRSASGYNVWPMEDMGETFNHEIGHSFGLKDEYYTAMEYNNLTAQEVTAWNAHVPNCDYSRPRTSNAYVTGKGYCTRWCKGVDSANYSIYYSTRQLFDRCSTLLSSRSTDWVNFCRSSLNFTRNYVENGYYARFVVDGNPTWYESVEQACTGIFSQTANSSDFYYTSNIEEFCFAGSLENIWDMNIGKQCAAGTGCYFGCGGFGRVSYNYRQYVGAFGDAFKPNIGGIMSGGPYGRSDAYVSAWLHKNDALLPSYGAYEINSIATNLRRRLATLNVLP